MTRLLRHILATEVSIWSRRWNAYVLGGTAEVTTSRRTAIEALQGDPDARRRQRLINGVFRVLTGDTNHCRTVLLEDEASARELIDLTSDFRSGGYL